MGDILDYGMDFKRRAAAPAMPFFFFLEGIFYAALTASVSAVFAAHVAVPEHFRDSLRAFL